MGDLPIPFLNRLADPRRASMVLVVVGALAVVLAFTRWAVAPRMVPLTDAIPMAEVGSWTTVLDEAGVEYRFASGGSRIEVPEGDYMRARVAVAGAELGDRLARQGSWGLFDETGFGGTEFEEQVRFRRALEGELSRTISGIRGIDMAEVRIALEGTSYLRGPDRPATASVKIRALNTMAPDPAVVEGVAKLVANAVPGLFPENVSVHDDSGRELSTGDESTGLSARQLAIQVEYERTLAAKAESLLSRMYGAGNALVQVSAELDFDQTQRQTQQFDPEGQVTLREDRAEIIPEEPSQGASSITSNVIYGTSETTETVIRGGARVQRLSVAVALADSREVAEDGTASVVPRSPDEIRTAEALVRSAVGVRPERGDLVTVTSAPFQPGPDLVAPPGGMDLVGLMRMGIRPVVGLAGILTALLLAFRLMANLKQDGSSSRGTLAGAAASAPLPAGDGGERKTPAGSEGMTRHPEPRPEPARVISSPTPAPVVEIQNPAMTARVLKSWLKEA